ncbi:hypothetical protein SS50377_26746 [Spironucleus salmonicida]|uniref:Uncharacterized protein n=1 Tax=Spironucleus salmonicida TaxID=348837 RepID=V6LXE3_9EUKA|nr:hypothetical protein SS50377_26746 [Spironucleus salmonicida]|eukprot:EST49215.1 hypothetical protein SS50377_10434 [Spironucleus salmonicida]
MSFYKISEKNRIIELEMQRKQRPLYHPVLHSLHPKSNENRTDHQVHAFDEYWRNQLDKPIKFNLDPKIKSKAYEAEQAKLMQQNIKSVELLNAVYDEISDDTPQNVDKKGKKK